MRARPPGRVASLLPPVARGKLAVHSFGRNARLMKGSRRELKVEGAVELPHVIAYLEQLVEGLRSGAAVVRRGEEQVVLGPRGIVGFSLAAVEKGKRQRLSLELSWRKFNAPSADTDLTIGPAPKAEPAASPASLYASGPDLSAYAGGQGEAEEAAGEEAAGEEAAPPEQAS